ncbi:hypothetical protein MIN45_P1492 [Methylomarinovum tepidoasis]|uniref:Doubled CXXCH motif domain-containing protein n=1 Tax=Methylomarinovum tepidoasis TaxID=2840183 RepID=A0AAU9CNB3_9GAMM|nr:hypothetical protein [Methylomarinovum sp. IN45]BCX89122.1 hypothetical protein MIN45_P1492 [Methylomarinovum sp. IN45]
MRRFLWGLALMVASVAAEKPKVPPLHHLVDIRVPDSMQVDPALPLPADRKLTCPVCHGIKDIDKKDFDKVDKDDPNFLRGGPYRDLTRFCFRCHDQESHQRPNIHAMLDDKGGIRKDHCLYCHEKAPERDRRYRLEEVKLRAPPDKLCWGCHLKTPHLNALEHQVKPSKKVKKQRKTFLRDHPEAILPLTSDGRVTCITCHTPHPPGVIRKDLPAAHQVAGAKVEKGPVYGDSPWEKTLAEDKGARLAELSRKYGRPLTFRYRQIRKEALLRLPAKDGQLCGACHVFDQ